MRNIANYPRIVELDHAGEYSMFIQVTEEEFNLIKKTSEENDGLIEGITEVEKIYCRERESGGMEYNVKGERFLDENEVEVPHKDILRVESYGG